VTVSRGVLALPFFFALTLFVSSALLFFIQPLFAKMVLPLLGGTPAVWNTCMVFFQAVLLAGYGYAHLAPAWLGVRRQAILHLGLLLLPFLVLNITVAKGWTPPATANPIPWLLGLLAISVGLPFFAVSTNGPLLQKWFAETGHPSAKDPYFLYGASNLGSMVALLIYPVLLEPTLSLSTHSRLWSAGYGCLVALMFVCTVFVCRSSPARAIRDHGPQTADRRPGTRRRLRWVALAFIPSSLMLSVTTYLTTDIAAIPLLWVIPLAIYLLTFILVFARKPLLSHRLIVRISPLIILLLALVMLAEATEPIALLLLIHLLALFMVAMVCHGELARDRPPPEHLTEFYLWLSVGGVLGGLFNALAAPLLFKSVVEYPLVLVLACLFRPAIPAGEGLPTPDRKSGRERKHVQVTEAPAPSLADSLKLDIGLPVLLGLVTIALVKGLQVIGPELRQVRVGLMFGPPAVVCYTFLHRPIRFGLGIGALLLAGFFHEGIHGRVLHGERSFFGVHRITLEPNGNYRQLVHGNTVHGRQSLDPARRDQPLTYYHRTGPIGQVFTTFSGEAAKPQVAIVGLGAGSLAAYGESRDKFTQTFTYYEIDPTVVTIARDSGYFTFIRDSRAQVKMVLGDARLTLQEAPSGQYGLIVLDAFSSDAIPLHLLTREALRIYKSKLAGDGILAFNISNRYLALEPVLGDLAQDAGLACWTRKDLEISELEEKEGKSPSQWVLMAHRKEHLGPLTQDVRWQEVKGRRDRAWTDDFSNLFSVFKWD
jgi:hypothetical protein